MSHAEVRVELLYRAPADCAAPSALLEHLRTPAWARLVSRFAAPSIKELLPAAPSVLALLESDWRVPTSHITCAVCAGCFEPTADAESCAARLPCGHELHVQCARSWLRQRSSCPTCCYQLPRALEGRFALRRLSSEVDAGAVVADGQVRVVVTLELERAGEDGAATKCELSASLASTPSMSAVHFDAAPATTRSRLPSLSQLRVLQHPSSQVARRIPPDHLSN